VAPITGILSNPEMRSLVMGATEYGGCTVSNHPLPFFVELLKSVQVSWRLLWDRRMPLWTKAVPLGAALYLIWPADLLADPVLGLGQLDDLALILLAARLFIALAPAALLLDVGGAEFRSQALEAPERPFEVEGKTRLLENPDAHHE